MGQTVGLALWHCTQRRCMMALASLKLAGMAASTVSSMAGEIAALSTTSALMLATSTQVRFTPRSSRFQ